MPAASAASRVPLAGNEARARSISIWSISRPRRLKLDRTADADVRAAQFPLLERMVKRLEPGESMTLEQRGARALPARHGELYASFCEPAESRRAAACCVSSIAIPMAASSRPPAAPCRCSMSPMSPSSGRQRRAERRRRQGRVQQAIDHVLEMQRYDGGFALWRCDRPGGALALGLCHGFPDPRQGQGLRRRPTCLLPDGLRWLDRLRPAPATRTIPTRSSARAYALYVLAEVGDEISRRCAISPTTRSTSCPRRWPQAQIGAALALHGDQQRAAAAFKMALRPEAGDRASPTGMATTAGRCATARPSSPWPSRPRLPRHRSAAAAGSGRGPPGQPDWLSTQEQGWLIMAAYAMSAALDRHEPRGQRQGAAGDGRRLLPAADAADLAEGHHRQERRHRSGVRQCHRDRRAGPGPAAGRAPASSIERSFFTPDGKAADLAKLKQSDVLVVVLTGKVRIPIRTRPW